VAADDIACNTVLLRYLRRGGATAAAVLNFTCCSVISAGAAVIAATVFDWAATPFFTEVVRALLISNFL
jgi:hypothetical protein